MVGTPAIRLVTRVSALGETDCEELGSGVLAQPVNAVSSLVFTVIGVTMAGWATAAAGTERWVRWAFVGTMAATGIGSFLYHGPQGSGSGFLHDITFLGVLAVLAIADLGAARQWSGRVVGGVLGATVGAQAAILLVAPGATNILTAASVAALVLADIALFGRSGRGTAWYVVAIVSLALAIASLVLGRTDAPLCEPEAWHQPHGAWHVLSAVALACYAVATGRRRVAATERIPTVHPA